MDAVPPDADAGSDIVDHWLGLIAALVVAGAGVAVAAPAYFADEIAVGGFLLKAAGIALLLVTPLAAAWATRRPDWQGAGLRAVGIGLVAAPAAVPVVHAGARLVGVAAPVPAVLLMVTAGIGAAVAAAGRSTTPWSPVARALAVLAVLLAPLAVIAAGELLGPHPSAVAQSLWLTGTLGVLPVMGLADLVAYALYRRRRATSQNPDA